MEHFSGQPLIDLARGVSQPEISKSIQTHLASGCVACQSDYKMWSSVNKLAALEELYTPPENLVRLVKLGFEGKKKPSPSWTLANLVFDSFTQPLPAGIRSGAANVWQVICEGEDLTVDLRFGRRAHSSVVQLVGQVFDNRASRALKNSATIELWTDHCDLVATTVVTHSGEFHLEVELKDPMSLLIKAEGRKAVRIPLTHPSS
jgi:hypothetical protein